jgi:hypothetical protein
MRQTEGGRYLRYTLHISRGSTAKTPQYFAFRGRLFVRWRRIRAQELLGVDRLGSPLSYVAEELVPRTL